MRFHIKEKIRPIIGQKRIIKTFALFPIRIENEIRWLEKVTIEQEFVEFCEEGDTYAIEWENKQFINN